MTVGGCPGGQRAGTVAEAERSGSERRGGYSMIFSPPSGPTRPFSAERGRVHRLLSVACADVRVQAPWPSFRLLLQPSFCCSSSPFTLPVSNATTLSSLPRPSRSRCLLDAQTSRESSRTFAPALPLPPRPPSTITTRPSLIFLRRRRQNLPRRRTTKPRRRSALSVLSLLSTTASGAATMCVRLPHPVIPRTSAG